MYLFIYLFIYLLIRLNIRHKYINKQKKKKKKKKKIHELYNLVQDRQRWCDVVAVASCQSWQDRTDRLDFQNVKT